MGRWLVPAFRGGGVTLPLVLALRPCMHEMWRFSAHLCEGLGRWGTQNYVQ